MLKTFFLNSTQAYYGEEEFNYIQKFLLQQGILNTQGADYNDFIDLQVAQHNAGNMSVDVKIGTAVINTTRNSVNFKVFVSNLALTNLVITPNTSGLNRVDAVILKLSRSTEPNTLMSNVATLEVVLGDGATALSDGDIQTSIGATYDFIRLADVTVSDSETAILTADIADTRIRCYNTDATIPNPTIIKFRQLTADPTTPAEGEMWYNTTDNKLRYFDGSVVINLEASAYTGGAGIDVIAGVITNKIPYYSFPVYENLTEGDILKSLSDDGVYKVAKIIGVKSTVTQSVSKTGNILKAKFSGNGKIVILTDTPKLYVATWDGTTMGALTDITPSTPTGLDDFDVSDEFKIIYHRWVSPTSYFGLIDISGTPSAGGETSVSTGTSNQSSGICFLTNTTFGFTTIQSITNYPITAISGSISALTITLGANFTNSTSGKYGTTSFPARSTRKIDSTHFGYAYRFEKDTPNKYGVDFWAFKNSSNVTTKSNTYIYSNDIGGSLCDWCALNGLVYFLGVLSSLNIYAVGTLTGDTISFTSIVNLTTNYNITRLFGYQSSVYALVGTTLYRFSVNATSFSGQVESVTISTLNTVCENLYGDKMVALSNDSGIKTTPFLLDTYDFIGIADKDYLASEEYIISSIYKKSGLAVGALYYIGTDGQSLSFNTANRKIGRAISDTLINKE